MAVACMGMVALVPDAHAGAAYTISVSQDGNAVDFLVRGAFDLTGLTQQATGTAAYPAFLSDHILLAVGTAGANAGIYWQFSLTGPTSIDTGLFRGYLQGASSGDVGGFQVNGPLLIVPTGYTSGTELSGTAIAPNQTLDGIGLTPGIYSWTYGTGGANTLEFDVVPPLPEPTSLMLFGLRLPSPCSRAAAADDPAMLPGLTKSRGAANSRRPGSCRGTRS
jgi:hypothetical protein